MKLTGSTILGGHPKAIAIVEVLDKLGWRWEIEDYKDERRPGVAVRLDYPGGGATFGGAATVDEAFEKLARWTAEKISPNLSHVAAMAERLLDTPGQYAWSELSRACRRDPDSVPEWPTVAS